MLHKLDFEISFTFNPKTIKGSHTFLPGLSAITGPNESGKSLRLEMIRYCLWGVKALRGESNTYGAINASLSFQVGDVMYNVVRKKTNATLDRNNRQIATGTSIVNAEIIRIFGYDMDVFDTANAVLQGKVEGLSDMKPTARKAMIDQTIGLNAVDDLIKEVTGEIAGQKTVVDSLTRQVTPTLPQPVMPEGYAMCAEEIETFIESTTELVREKDKIETMILALNCDNPGPVPAVDGESLDVLYEQKATYDALIREAAGYQNELDTANKIARPEVYGMLELDSLGLYLDENGPEQWAEYEEYATRITALTTALPKTSLEEIERFITYLNAFPTYSKIVSLESQKVKCPECSHEFSLMADAIDELKSQLPADMDQLLTDFMQSDYAAYSTKALPILISDKQKWVVYNMFVEKPAVLKPDCTFQGTRKEAQSTLNSAEAWQKAEETKSQLVSKMDTVLKKIGTTFVDYDILISIRKKQEDALRQHTINDEKYQKFQAYVTETKDWLKQLQGSDQLLLQYRTQGAAARAYESSLKEWSIRNESNEAIKEQVAEQQLVLDDLLNARKALNDIKPKVKRYLVPSLNRVASNLLSQMTDGARNLVQVNEEFDIWVDNQPIDTLSGSGKAVANLAIRIALGTVLTNQVFSVLMADEIDASMDQKRAEYTAGCLRNLTKSFKQVILISHKEPEADHQIVLT